MAQDVYLHKLEMEEGMEEEEVAVYLYPNIPDYTGLGKETW
jgi:hypothetical protein